jgi:hypothetical protein
MGCKAVGMPRVCWRTALSHEDQGFSRQQPGRGRHALQPRLRLPTQSKQLIKRQPMHATATLPGPWYIYCWCIQAQHCKCTLWLLPKKWCARRNREHTTN